MMDLLHDKVVYLPVVLVEPPVVQLVTLSHYGGSTETAGGPVK